MEEQTEGRVVRGGQSLGEGLPSGPVEVGSCNDLSVHMDEGCVCVCVCVCGPLSVYVRTLMRGALNVGSATVDQLE